MLALRRAVRINGGPMRPLDLQTVCDQCNKSRAHGNHTKCSKLRQAEAAERHAPSATVFIPIKLIDTPNQDQNN